MLENLQAVSTSAIKVPLRSTQSGDAIVHESFYGFRQNDESLD